MVASAAAGFIGLLAASRPGPWSGPQHAMTHRLDRVGRHAASSSPTLGVSRGQRRTMGRTLSSVSPLQHQQQLEGRGCMSHWCSSLLSFLAAVLVMTHGGHARAEEVPQPEASSAPAVAANAKVEAMASEDAEEEVVTEADAKRAKARQRIKREGRIAADISPEERTRRRTTKSVEMLDEEWYKRSRAVFIAQCSGCHAAGQNIVVRNKSLTLRDLERNKVDDEEMRSIIRYGRGTMPGYSLDCPDVVDAKKCSAFQPLQDDTLENLQDWIWNRANMKWKGKA